MASESESQPQSLEVTFDCECMECGYNLRGLSGEPVRCPECGHLNPVHEVHVTPEAIAWQLRRMETPLAVCALATVLGIPLVGLCVYVAFHDLTFFSEGMFPCPAVSLFGLLIAWWSCVMHFRDACECQPAWAPAFWRYQVRAVASAAFVASPILAGSLLLSHYSRGGGSGTQQVWIVLGVLAVVALVVGIAIVVAPRMHRSLRKTIDPLVRETATQLAWESMRERMRSARR